MPRIRSLKPEALQHRKVGRLSDRAFRLWIGLITQADDEGRVAFDLRQFRVLIWGYFDRLKPSTVANALDELRSVSLCRLYVIDGQIFVDLPSWHDHQAIQKAIPSKLPKFQEQYADYSSPTVALQYRYCSPTVGLQGDRRKEGSDLKEPLLCDSPPASPRPTAPRGPRVSSPPPDQPGFDLFWAAWPPARRKAKLQARAAWRALHPSPSLLHAILTALESQKSSPDWSRDAGRFIPYPHRWLAKRRWEDVAPPAMDPYASFPREPT